MVQKQKLPFLRQHQIQYQQVMKQLRKSKKKGVNDSFNKIRFIVSIILLAGVVYWDSKDVELSIEFSLFIGGSYIIMWFLIYLYTILKRNHFNLITLKSIDKEFLIAFTCSIVVYFFVSKFLLYWGVLSIIFISISLLLIDIIRNMTKK